MFFHHVINVFILCSLARGHLPVDQPTFRSSPLTVRSMENETVFLPCIVENLGNSEIVWWKGKTTVSPPRTGEDHHSRTPWNILFSRDGMSVLNVTLEDAGEYTCEVVRPKPRSSLKQTHKVVVLLLSGQQSGQRVISRLQCCNDGNPDPIFVCWTKTTDNRPRDPPKVWVIPYDGKLEVVLGERVHMKCLVKGMPPPRISWRTEALAMPPVQNDTQVLDFVATSHLFSGIYQCEADNGLGNPVHKNLFLRIKHKPVVTAEKSWIHSAPGIKTSLICRVHADPEAHVEWLHNETILNHSPPRVTFHVRRDNHILLFESVTASDFGNYTCRAANHLGKSQAFMQLSGAANPVIFKKVQGKAGEEFSLIWEVDSISPVFDYKLLFRKVGNRRWVSFIIPADSSSSGPLHSKSYTFTGLDKLSAYEAKIFARNRFGWSNSSEIVTFGLMNPTYAEENRITSRVVAVAESTSSARELYANGISLLPAAWTVKFFLSICDTF